VLDARSLHAKGTKLKDFILLSLGTRLNSLCIGTSSLLPTPHPQHPYPHYFLTPHRCSHTCPPKVSLNLRLSSKSPIFPLFCEPKGPRLRKSLTPAISDPKRHRSTAHISGPLITDLVVNKWIAPLVSYVNPFCV